MQQPNANFLAPLMRAKITTKRPDGTTSITRHKVTVNGVHLSRTTLVKPDRTTVGGEWAIRQTHENAMHLARVKASQLRRALASGTATGSVTLL